MRCLKLFAPAAIAAMMLVSCEKELDIKYRDIDPIPVIEGALTTGGATVVLTMTTPMDEPMDRTRLTDATVELADLTSGETVTLTPDTNGDYVSGTPGLPGHDYRLTVSRGETVYTSECRMLPAPEIAGMEFNWIKMPYDHVAVLQVLIADDPATTGDCYWVRVYRNGEIYRWTYVRDNLAEDGYIAEVIMTSRRDVSEEDDEDVLVDGDVVSATVTRISRAMYDYLEAISSDSNGPAMFAGDFCLGYFTAGGMAERSVVFRPADIPEYK